MVNMCLCMHILMLNLLHHLHHHHHHVALQDLPDFAVSILQLDQPRPCVLACKGCMGAWTHSGCQGAADRPYLVTCSTCDASYHAFK
jgi:hypothetical protein